MPAEVVVADANVLVDLAARDLLREPGLDLVTPGLGPVECASVLHAMGARNGAAEYVRVLHERILAGGVRVDPDRDGREVWRIASALGWSKTYDAEYLALATRLGVGIATLDGRVRSAAARLGIDVVAVP